MAKVVVKKGNINRSDIFRGVITDTAPADIPIVISNDGFATTSRPEKQYLSTPRDS